MAYQPYHQKRIVAGLCKDCGSPRGEDGTSIYCRACAAKIQARANTRKEAKRKEWAASGALVCNGCGGILPDTTFKLCEKCRQYHSSHWKKTQPVRLARKASIGQCASCSSDALTSSRYCKKHFLDSSLRKYRVPMDDYNRFWEKLEAQEFRCYYTGIEILPGVNASIDHKVPVSRGGSRADIDNCVWCDRNINAFKNDSTDIEFIDLCKRIADRFP